MRPPPACAPSTCTHPHASLGPPVGDLCLAQGQPHPGGDVQAKSLSCRAQNRQGFEKAAQRPEPHRVALFGSAPGMHLCRSGRALSRKSARGARKWKWGGGRTRSSPSFLARERALPPTHRWERVLGGAEVPQPPPSAAGCRYRTQALQLILNFPLLSSPPFPLRPCLTHTPCAKSTETSG